MNTKYAVVKGHIEFRFPKRNREYAFDWLNPGAVTCDPDNTDPITVETLDSCYGDYAEKIFEDCGQTEYYVYHSNTGTYVYIYEYALVEEHLDDDGDLIDADYLDFSIQPDWIKVDNYEYYWDPEAEKYCYWDPEQIVRNSDLCKDALIFTVQLADFLDNDHRQEMLEAIETYYSDSEED